jgi:O-succinylbenzoate synthase
VNADRARHIVTDSGCRTAAVRVGQTGGSLGADIARVEAVRDAIGPTGAIRCDAGGSWDTDTAPSAIAALDRAAGGLEFIQQPCRTLDKAATLRAQIGVPIAMNAVRTTMAAAADIAVVNVADSGGVRRALRVAEICGVPCVVAASLQSSVGIAGGLALAGVLPESGFASELATVALLRGDVVSAGRSLIPVDGYLPVAPMPAAPDPERLARFAATDPDTVRWWRDRLAAAQRYI